MNLRIVAKNLTIGDDFQDRIERRLYFALGRFSPAVKATSRPSADTAGSEAKPGAPSLTVLEVCAARSRRTTREAVAPRPPVAGLVTAVNATKRPSAEIRGS